MRLPMHTKMPNNSPAVLGVQGNTTGRERRSSSDALLVYPRLPRIHPQQVHALMHSTSVIVLLVNAYNSYW